MFFASSGSKSLLPPEVTLKPFTVFSIVPSSKPAHPGRLATTPLPVGSQGSVIPSVQLAD